jgi:KipI family sensor histidine kinase inhibitor
VRSVLPSGSAGVLVEVDHLQDVLDLYAALVDESLPGVVDLVPAASTVLVVIDPEVTSVSATESAVRALPPGHHDMEEGEEVELPVVYDGEDLAEVAALLGCDVDEVVRRHTAQAWTVAFCGFAPGFGYMTSDSWKWDLPRRSSPRTRVPPGAVALAGPFCGVYPRESPGGWQLIGRTEVQVFDLSREPPALLRPGNQVRFVVDES